MKHIIIALLSGLLFGVGLDLGGMTNPQNIIGFLDIAGAWNPSLLFVMGGAVVVTFIGYRLTFSRQHPILAADFILPQKQDLDPKLLGGAALFGIGWGLGGYCPGPAISSLSAGHGSLFAFVGAMIAGMIVTKVVAGSISRSEVASQG